MSRFMLQFQLELSVVIAVCRAAVLGWAER